jgi:adenosylhomocysteinase
MEDFERARVDAYFRRITTRFATARRPSAVLITHLLADRPLFVAAAARLSTVAAVLPKPKSINSRALQEIIQMAPCDALDRKRLAQPDELISYLETRAAGQDLVLLDVGGYFAPALEDACARFSGRVLGVVEDTENGLRRYLEAGKLPCPVFSVARSPLKDPEDYLVGQSVVFSAEALLRGRGDILHGRRACVIGFGKIGSSVARLLHAKHLQVTVYDTDAVRMTQALRPGILHRQQQHGRAGRRGGGDLRDWQPGTAGRRLRPPSQRCLCRLGHLGRRRTRTGRPRRPV